MLHKIDRQKKIIENLDSDHVTTIQFLCKKTQFTESTIRRDLKTLEQEKKLILHRGGVILNQANKEPSHSIESIEEKRSIAKYAASLINKKEKIIINGGSTCSLIADYIDTTDLTVLTNSFLIATKLVNKDIANVIIPGGTIYKRQSLIISPFNFEQIKHFHASKLFLSCRSLNRMGLLDDDENLVNFVNNLLKISDEIILLIDNSKFYKNIGQFVICPLDKIDTIITNKSIANINFLKKYNFKTILTNN
jgi:DeoR family ulaG and ulaABCDEF operon transcriptional repressor